MHVITFPLNDGMGYFPAEIVIYFNNIMSWKHCKEADILYSNMLHVYKTFFIIFL